MEKFTCVDCGAEFELSAEEMKWYEDKGFTLPKRCPECRKQRKLNRKKNKK
jgi:DNA-directed RNA polymerase subunit RPC12/RpoP